MPGFIVELPLGVGQVLQDGKNSLVVFATDAAEAKAVAQNAMRWDVNSPWASLALTTALAAPTDWFTPTAWGFRVSVYNSAGVLENQALVLSDSTNNTVDEIAALLVTALTKTGFTPSYSARVKATGTLTFTGVVAAAETVTIGNQVYTFRAALSGGGLMNEVLIGVDQDAALTNLTAAINGTAGAGTTYGNGTPVNSNVTGVANTVANTLTVTAKVGGANTTATTETMLNGAWGGATLAGGSGTGVLTVAAAGDTKGDRTVVAEAFPQITDGANEVTVNSASFYGTITHQGAAGSALTVALAADNAVPTAAFYRATRITA